MFDMMTSSKRWQFDLAYDQVVYKRQTQTQLTKK